MGLFTLAVWIHYNTFWSFCQVTTGFKQAQKRAVWPLLPIDKWCEVWYNTLVMRKPESTNTHGGKRAGAGRPPSKETQLRVAEHKRGRLIEQFELMLDELADAGPEILKRMVTAALGDTAVSAECPNCANAFEVSFPIGDKTMQRYLNDKLFALAGVATDGNDSPAVEIQKKIAQALAESKESS